MVLVFVLMCVCNPRNTCSALPLAGPGVRSLQPCCSRSGRRMSQGLEAHNPQIPFNKEDPHTEAINSQVLPETSSSLQEITLKKVHQVKGIHARAVQEDLQLRGRIHIGKVHGELYLVIVSSGRNCMQEQRKSGRIPPPEEKVTERACEEPTPATSIPCPLVLLEGRR